MRKTNSWQDPLKRQRHITDMGDESQSLQLIAATIRKPIKAQTHACM